MCETSKLWEKCVEFHGHECPGLAIGYRASLAAMEKLNLKFSQDEELVCVTENDACGVDAVQVLTGCSLGKGNLIYRGTGKQAFSFFNRSTGDKVRIVFKASLNRDGMCRREIQDYILKSPLEELFDFKEPTFPAPENARIFRSVACEQCGENASENKIRLQDNKKLCLDCCQEYSRGW